jgi:hypothetical protein
MPRRVRAATRIRRSHTGTDRQAAAAIGGHHSGAVIVLSSPFSRSPAGYGAIVTALAATTMDQFDDRLVYLERRGQD